MSIDPWIYIDTVIDCLVIYLFITPVCINSVDFAVKSKFSISHFYCTSYRLNMFRALLCPSLGACDYNVDYHIGRFVLGLL